MNTVFTKLSHISFLILIGVEVEVFFDAGIDVSEDDLNTGWKSGKDNEELDDDAGTVDEDDDEACIDDNVIGTVTDDKFIDAFLGKILGNDV